PVPETLGVEQPPRAGISSRHSLRDGRETGRDREPTPEMCPKAPVSLRALTGPEFEDRWRMASSSPSRTQESPSSRPPTPSSFSLETMIRPARDGIAVSLRLVDSTVKPSPMDPALSGGNAVGWVSPNTWDSRRKCSQVSPKNVFTKEPRDHACAPPLRSQGVRTVRFAEEPCTPWRQRKQGTEQNCRFMEEANGGPASVRHQGEGCEDQTQTIAIDSSSPVVGTSERCQIIIDGQGGEGDRSSTLEMVPRLHVVPGKKTTAFGLVSPKLRRRVVTQADTGTEPQAPRPPAAPSLTADDLLTSGIMCLTGGLDRCGRALLEVCGDHQLWATEEVSGLELCRLLLYFHSISRRSSKALGMTVVFDARKKPLHPEFSRALVMLHGQRPGAVRWLLLLVNKDSSQSSERPAGVATEAVCSLKALLKLVEARELSTALHGSLLYSLRDWSPVHQKLFPFVSDLHEASVLLSGAIKTLEGVLKIDSVPDIQQCIEEQAALMRNVLEDARLVDLQREGGAFLTQLWRETDARSPHCKQIREAIDRVRLLYTSMEEQVHVLARKSNTSLQQMHFLSQLREMEASDDGTQQTLQNFQAFISEANDQRQRSMQLEADAEGVQGPNSPESETLRRLTSAFRSGVEDSVSRAERCCEELEMLLYIRHFSQKASAVASECQEFLEQHQHLSTIDEEQRDLLLLSLEEFSPQLFQNLQGSADLGGGLVPVRGGSGAAGGETEEIGGRSEEPESVQDVPETRAGAARDSIHVTCFSFKPSPKPRRSKGSPARSGHRAKASSRREAQEQKLQTVGCQWFPWQSATYRRPEIHITEPITALPEHSRHGGIGAEGSVSADGWRNEGGSSAPAPENPNKNMKLQRIVEELLLTEAEYVRSLGFILTHYVPLLSRPDIPQDLRGQRGRIFGNLEKLHHFHSQLFQQDLQGCPTEPLGVARCFLKHRESFGLYALYSKNKPQSDALIQHHRYFKRKQQELGDSMDLSSYLLKPIQRVSKYSLLLQELLDECVTAQEREQVQGALDIIRFQLRHGNDLLTMDAIRDCDLNLNEQGQLIRQDEFWVIFRKKRSLRRVFLFQEVILFTKTKKNSCGDDVYVYKLSIKTCELGMTHSCGLSGRSFEIWFRRRRSQDTYILQAETQEAKEAWTRDLEHILWEQARSSREMRRQERMFMGMNWKPLDVQPRSATINHATPSDVTGRVSKGAGLYHHGLIRLVLSAAPRLHAANHLPRLDGARCLPASSKENTSLWWRMPVPPAAEPEGEHPSPHLLLFISSSRALLRSPERRSVLRATLSRKPFDPKLQQKSSSDRAVTRLPAALIRSTEGRQTAPSGGPSRLHLKPPRRRRRNELMQLPKPFREMYISLWNETDLFRAGIYVHVENVYAPSQMHSSMKCFKCLLQVWKVLCGSIY
ncbi:hypothetical protein DNTS_005276, partial [Danionella cerebrum]